MEYKIGDRVILKNNLGLHELMNLGCIMVIEVSKILSNRYKIKTIDNNVNMWVSSSEIELDKRYYREEKLKLLEI
jgi:hypothetical protein